MFQKLFASINPQNIDCVPILLEMVEILLDINEISPNTVPKKRKFSTLEELWGYINSLSLSKESQLLTLYDSWWSKSQLSSSSSKTSSNKTLHILNQGFSASITHAMKSFVPSPIDSFVNQDSKFYQQLLKDIIDTKLSSSSKLII